MPRKLRLEEAGGLYHVINRGNYRQPVFASDGSIKGQDWRLAIAAQLRSHGAPYAWIAAKLGFPQPNSLKIKLFRFHCNVSM